MNWELKPKAPDKIFGQFPELPSHIVQLLYNRGLDTQEKIDEFFNPDYEQDLHDPFLMHGVSQAAKRIAQAAKNKEKTAIFGDYDADGICGAVILKLALEACGVDISGGIYIPDRLVEGYGLNPKAIKMLAEKEVKLILTVDCGVTDFAEIELANSLGMEVVVVDHHRVGKKLPPAKIIIDPWQKKDKYPFKELAGAGVAFKLAQALVQKNKKIKKGWEKWLLDLVALATVADCMPLLGENRTLVRYGLIVLAQTQRPGLRELMRIARLSPTFEAESLKTNLDAYSLGFVLAPRLNAAGRIHHASAALELLLCEAVGEAAALAKRIDEFNRQRQKLIAEIINEIEARLKKTGLIGPVIIQTDKNWSLGVIGLVAGKIADKYHRPTFVFRQNETKTRGSARSIPAFNIIEAIADCEDILKEFGGHAGAAGLELDNEHLEIFTKKINQIASSRLSEKDLIPVLEIDLELRAQDINWQFFDELVRLEPFGNGNPHPVFLLKSLEVASVKIVGNGAKHLKLELKADKMPGKTFRAIGFNLANGHQELKYGDRIDLAFELLVDEWNGNRELQFKILDIRKEVC